MLRKLSFVLMCLSRIRNTKLVMKESIHYEWFGPSVNVILMPTGKNVKYFPKLSQPVVCKIINWILRLFLLHHFSPSKLKSMKHATFFGSQEQAFLQLLTWQSNLDWGCTTEPIYDDGGLLRTVSAMIMRVIQKINHLSSVQWLWAFNDPGAQSKIETEK